MIKRQRKSSREIRGQRIVTLFPESSVRDGAQTLVMEDVLQAPVVRSKDEQKLMGIVTLHDIARQQNTIGDSIGR
ncbi:MAG: CBS domain-containing protein [Oceanipulchritudo sp.]